MDAVDAYPEFANRHGMAPLIITTNESGGDETGCAAASSLLHEHPEVNAIYATVNAFAVDVVPALTDRGLRVPADVMVTTP
ncbi:substrate-binding domain-containing protein [Saccharopolyspora spinosa]|uniref:substrate-binding domain-containing protein n=1 Tax=Saccharopolyspora spinosa TaxID=60894 RepID=UPI000C6F2962|nr:substrate-binding domain-containing protein [Saccharopolyspora spinosa]